MKKSLSILLLFQLVCPFAFSGNPEKGGRGKEAKTPLSKAEEIKEKFNQGTFSLHPFGFMENKGQITGPDGLVFPEAKFEFQQGNTKIFLLEKGIAYQFTKTHYPKGYLDLLKKKDGTKNFEELKTLQKQIKTETYRMDMSLQGANANAEIVKEGQSADAIHYYNLNVLDVRTYDKITYKEIYPGIDWVIYTKGKEIKYDFIVRPGADASRIKMNFSNYTDLKIEKNGNFSIKNDLGKITEKAPISFQNGKKIATKFKREGNALFFELADYNKSEELIIDPTLVWATYYGGSSGEGNDGSPSPPELNFCTSDASGNVYLGGGTSSSFSIASGGHQNTYGSFFDAFLVKFNSSGVRQWATYYGGGDQESGRSAVVDASGNVYLTGSTGSTLQIASGGHQNTFGGDRDAYLVKFNSSGTRQWATYYGDAGLEEGRTCALDGSGNIYIAGITNSTTNIANGASHQATYGGGYVDGFVVKFNSSGTYQWSTYYGGANTDFINGSCVDGSGNIILTGYSDSPTGLYTTGAYQNYSTGEEAFLVKFNSSGVRQWGTYYGNVNTTRGWACCVDASGNIFMVGHTSSNSAIASVGSHQSTYGGGGDAFLVKFNGSGTFQWGTYYGDTDQDRFFGCVVDGLGNIIASGDTRSTNAIAAGGFQNTNSGNSDLMLVKFNTSGVRLWGSYFGGTDFEVGGNCAIGINNEIYLSGATTSTAGISTVGAHQTSHGGGTYDALLVKFCDNNLSIPSAISGNTSVCSSTASVIYSVTLDVGATSYSWTLPVGWSGTSTTNTILVSPVSSGVLSVTASNSCGTSPEQTLAITVSPIPTLVITPSSTVICSGNSATLTASNAVTYTWSGGPNTASYVVSPTVTTSYTVVGSSAAGCTNTAVQTISVNTTPVLTITPTSTVICSGNSATLSGSGASTYTWSGGPSTASFAVSPTITTIYTLTATSAAGCTNTASQSVSVNTTPTLIMTPSSTVICSGNSATLTASGASTYTWSGGPSTAAYAVSPTVTTIYTVTGTSSGCTNTAVQSISVITTPTVSISTTGSVICSGFHSTLTASGANSYAWVLGPPTNTFDVNPTTNSNYTVIGTAVNGCTTSAIQSVSVNATPTLVITPSSTVTCTGKTAILTASNASTYTWSGGPSTASYAVSPTVTTVYTVTGTSAAGCTNTAVQNMSVIASPTVTISNTGTVLCAGETTTLNSSGASSYAWVSGPGTSSYAVSPGVTTTYTLTGTAANGCTVNATQQVSVNPLPPLVITPSSTVICSGKSATLTASGANSYTWSAGPNTAAFVVSPSVTTVYTVSGTTATSGCTNTVVRTISVNLTPTITISPSSTVLCLGKTATLTGLGGTNYTWTSGPTTNTYAVSPTITTIYTLTGVTAASGCTNTTVQSVSVNALTAINITPAAPVICSGNTSTITASGVSSYTWTSGPTTASYAVTPSVTTAYTVTGTDAATSCSNTAVVNVSVNITPTVSANSGSICSGNNFIIIPSGASTYTVTGGTTIVNPMTTSSYSVTGTSAAGCIATNTAVSTVTVFITPTVAVNSGSICTGNSFTMVPSGASTYTYSSGSNIVSPLITTAYSVTGSSTAGCISANIAVSNVTVNITPTVSVNSGSLCTGQVFTMTPSGAATYTFSSGSSTVNPLITSSYSVTGTSAAGCIATNTAVSNVTVYTTPTVAATSGSICTGNSFVIVPSGASTYTITGSGSFTVSPTAFTSYSVIGTSTNGCVSANTATSSVTPYTTPTITIVPTPANGIICVGQYAWMVANGAATYTWVSGPASQAYTVNPISNASYTVFGTAGSSGCTNTAVFNMTVNTTPTVTIVPSNTLLCSGNTTTLTASGTSSYTWSPAVSNFSSAVFSPTASTVYTVIGTAANNCTALAVQSVSVNLTPTLLIIPSSSVICSGNSPTLTVSGAATYSWNTSSSSSSIVVSPSVNTTYSVTGATNGCTSTAVQALNVNLTPTVTLVPSSTVICTGKSATIAASGAGTYTWNTSALTASINVSPSVNTSYTVNATSASNNCTASAVQAISVNITPTVTITPSSTLICTGRTTTFTANGANTYTWTNSIITPSLVLSPSVTTGYTVVGTNSASGCTNTASQNLSVNITPTITLVQTNTIICSGKSVTINLSGASSYSWNTGAVNANIIFSPTVSTNYSVIGFATNNCTSSAATSVSVNTTPTISVNSGTICEGQIFTITPTGASNYTISGGSNTVSPTSNTVYLVAGSSTNGCIATNTPAANVIVNPLPPLTVNGGSICIGNSFTLQAGGASSYTWDSGANTASLVVSPIAPTVYTVTGSNSFNCVKTKTTAVIALIIPNVSISGNTGVCIGKSTTLTANGANSFTWSPGAQTTSVIVVSPSVVTTYSVKGILGSNSCSNTASQVISINPLPNVSISGNTFVCQNSPVLLTASGAATYTWSEGTISSSVNITPSVSANYTVNGTDTLGCVNSATISLTTAAMKTPSICLVTVDSLSNYNEIYWDKTLFPRADTFIVYRESDASIYSVIARIPKSAFSSYVDTNRSIGPNVGNPNQSFYKYKLQYRDSCGNLSVMSQWHQTIKVNDYQNGIFTWNYYNIGGVDYQFANYYLWRYHTITGTLTLLGGTSGNSFTDPLYPSVVVAGDYKWYVTTSGFNCNPSQKTLQTSATKNGTKSNNSNERQFPTPEGVNENLLTAYNFKIFPNPTEGKFMVSGHGLEDFQVTITDLLGKEVFVPFIRDHEGLNFDARALTKGLYMVQISRGKERLVKKIVIN